MKNRFEMFRDVLVSVVGLFLIAFMLFGFFLRVRNTYEAERNVSAMESLDTGVSLKDNPKEYQWAVDKVSAPFSDDNYVVFADVVNNYSLIKLPEGSSLGDTYVGNDTELSIIPVTKAGYDLEFPKTSQYNNLVAGDTWVEPSSNKYLPLSSSDLHYLKSKDVNLEDGVKYAKVYKGFEVKYRGYYKAGYLEDLTSYMQNLPKLDEGAFALAGE